MSYTTNKKVKKVKEGRIDCTDYLIHFTREQGDKTAFNILEQILYSGYIKSGWSYRSTKNTIFGPRKAVCFTEMPLWSLDLYVNNRKERFNVDCYGIALRKSDVFRFGARNVIYGTSSSYEREIRDETTKEMYNLNLPVQEQYRYMLTAISDTNDWTHEREWRWANWTAPDWLINNSNTVDGLPLYKMKYGSIEYNYEEIIVIVQTDEEKNKILSDLRSSIAEHSKIENNVPKGTKPIIFDTYLMGKTKVIVVNKIKSLNKYFSIEDAIVQGQFYVI